MSVKAKNVFSLEEKEKFSGKIPNYPYVYDKYKKEYKGQNTYENAWKEIVQKLDVPESGKISLPFFGIFRGSH